MTSPGLPDVLPLAFVEIGFAEMVVVGIVALLLFGGRLPEVMRSLGASYRTLRRGFDDLSRQALRPEATPYRPIPPASTRSPSDPAAEGPATPSPWSHPVAPPPASPAAPVTDRATQDGGSPRPPVRADDDVPFV